MPTLLQASADTGDTAWLLAASALVLLMAPGLALFYGGMVRSKSVLNMMMMTMGAAAVILMIWVLFGYSESFGDDIGGGLLGNPFQYAGLGQLLPAGVDTGTTYPLILFAMFEGLFAVITGALVSGAIADRARFSSWLVYIGLWTTLVYAPVAHWVFDISAGRHVGGWLANQLHLVDYAGGTAVEVCSGASAFALAIVLGRRLGFGQEPMRPHNLTYVMLGAGLLWFGWYGFNAGSALGANHNAAVVFATTTVAAAAGVAGWLALERVRDGHFTSFGAASGLVAGLVAITPSCGSLSPLGALLVGLAAGATCCWAVGIKYRFGYDDSLDVVGVHLVGGIVGTLAIGILATHLAPTGVSGLFDGGGLSQLGRQSIGVAVVGAYAFTMSGLLGIAIERTIGFRVARDHEVGGVDLALHAETAYDLHTLHSGRASGHGILAALHNPGPADDDPVHRPAHREDNP